MIKIEKKKIYCYIIIFFFFYTSDSVYTYIYSELDHLIELLTDFLMFCSLFYLKKQLIIKIIFPVTLMGIIMYLIQVINALWGADMLNLIAVMLRILSVCIFTAWTIQEKIPILQYVVKFIVCIASIFLLLYILYDYSILGIQPERVCIGNKSMLLVYTYRYSSFYYSWDSVRSYFGVAIPSASGFWREPGVTQIFYNFAILYYWFIKPEENKWICTIILIIGIFSTGSTMGYIILIGLVAIKFWVKDIRFAIVAVTTTIVLGKFALNIFEQRYGNGNIYRSSRMMNLMTAIDNWRNSPIMGCGYSSKLTSWAGILNYFVNFGIFGFYPIWIIFKFMCDKRSEYKIKEKIALFYWWLLCLINEACGYSMFFIMLYFLVYNNALFKLKSVDVF